MGFNSSSSSSSPSASSKTLVQVQMKVVLARVHARGWVTGKAVFDGVAPVDAPVKAGVRFGFAGSLGTAAPGDILRVTGSWETHEQWGLQIRVSTAAPVLGGSEAGLAAFLERLPQFGQVRAREAIRLLGREGVLNALRSPDGAKLTRVSGITPERAAEAAGEFKKQERLLEAFTFLNTLTVDESVVAAALETWGARALSLIHEDPYVLMELRGCDFKLADKVARGVMGLAEDDPRRCAAGARVAMEESANEGHVYSALGDLVGGRTGERVTRLTGLSRAQLSAGVETCVDSGKAVVEVPADDPAAEPRIYAAADWESEDLLARSLARLRSVQLEPVTLLESDWGGVVPDATQVAAVELCLGPSAVSVITGGPGTGKSTVTKAIVTALRRVGRSILLAAPTGAAAQRLKEASGLSAATLHRTLGWNPAEGGFLHSEGDPLDCAVLVIDESSMCSLDLLAGALDACRTGTRVVLVGDVDQLPPVGVGQPFSDLVLGNVLSVGRLTHIHRQASESVIPYLARSINAGESLDLSGGAGFTFAEVGDLRELADTVIEVVRDRLFEGCEQSVPYDSIQVICPQKGTDIGTEAINRRLQGELNPGEGGIYIGAGYQARAGDRVIHTKNNYQIPTVRTAPPEVSEATRHAARALAGADDDGLDGGLDDGPQPLAGVGVFNGEAGRLLACDFRGLSVDELLAAGALPGVGYTAKGNVTDKIAIVAFPDRVALYGKADVRELQLGYAITTHRSQGRSIPYVVYVAHSQHGFMLDRANTYTGITRTSKACLVIGQADALAKAVSATWRKERRSSLLERVAAADLALSRRASTRVGASESVSEAETETEE